MARPCLFAAVLPIVLGCSLHNTPPAPLAAKPVTPAFTAFVSASISVVGRMAISPQGAVSGGVSESMLLRGPGGRLAFGVMLAGRADGAVVHRMRFLLLPEDVIDAATQEDDFCVLRRDAKVICSGPREEKVDIAVEADAERIFFYGDARCVLRKGGAWTCYSAKHEKSYEKDEPAADDLGRGRVAKEPVPDAPCIISVDRKLHCFQDGRGWHIVGVPDVVQASVSGGDGDAGGGCAVQRTGKVYCWGGMNDTGVFGNGQRGPGDEADVIGVSDAIAVARTPDHACALTKSHTVWCWGSADQYAFGDAALASSTSFASCPDDKPSGPDCVAADFAGLSRNHLHLRAIQVPELAGITSIAAGVGITCGTRTDGRILCVGDGHPGAFTVDVGEK